MASLIEKIGFTGKQAFGLLSIVLLIVGGMVLPPEAYEAFFSGATEISRDVIREEIEAYIDQGLGGSPYQTEKNYEYGIGNLTVSGTAYYYIVNGSNGRLWTYSTNPSTMMEQAMNALTAGRSWKEKVVCRGEFYINETIDVPSYTIIDFTGSYIYLVDDTNDEMIQNIDGATTIEIIGGMWEGNRAGQNVGAANAIQISNCTKLVLKDASVYDSSLNGINFDETEDSQILHCYVEDYYYYGIVLDENANGNLIDGCIIRGGVLYDSVLINKCHNNTVSNTAWYDSPNCGLHIYQGAHNNKVVGCLGANSTTANFRIGHEAHADDPCNGNLMASCTALGHGTGFYIDEGMENIFDGIIAIGCSTGINIDGNYNKISGSVINCTGDPAVYITADYNMMDVTVENPYATALSIYGGDYNFVTDSDFINTDSTLYAIDIAQDSDYNTIKDCVFSGWTSNARHIIINSGCDYNHIGYNEYDSASRPVDDNAGNTEFNEVLLSFMNASEWQAASPPFGGKIDASDEFVLAGGHIPNWCDRVIKIKVYGISLETEPQNMTLELEAYAATDNEPYTTETIAVANWKCTSFNFAANDRIYWMADLNDDSDINDIFAWDWLEVKVLHESADGDACATNVLITAIVIEIV